MVGKTNVLIEKTYQYLQFSGQNRVLRVLKFFGWLWKDVILLLTEN